MKFYNNFDGFMLKESVKQAKKYMDEKGIDYTTEGSPGKEAYDGIVKDLSKMNNLIGNFVKYHFEENIPYIDPVNIDESEFADIYSTIEYITKNKNKIQNMLKKNIIDYDSFEHLTDDLREAEMKQKIKTDFVDSVLINKVNIYEDEYDRTSPIKEVIEGNYKKNFDFNNQQMMSVAQLYIEEFEKFIKSQKFKKYIIDNRKDEKKDRIPSFMSVYDILPIHVAMKTKMSLLNYLNEIEEKIINVKNLDNVNSDGSIDSKEIKMEKFKQEIREDFDYESTNLVFESEDVLVYRSFRKTFVVKYGSKRWCIVTNPETYYNQYISPVSGKTQYIIFNYAYEPHDKRSMWGVTINNSDGSTPSGGCQDRFNTGHILREVESINQIPKGILIPHEYSDKIVMRYQGLDDLVRSMKSINTEGDMISKLKANDELLDAVGCEPDILQICYNKGFWDVFIMLIESGANPNIALRYGTDTKTVYLLHELLFSAKSKFRTNPEKRIELLTCLFNSNRLDVDITDELFGRTALHNAVKSADIANKNTFIKKGYTEQEAEQEVDESVRMVETLLKKGANPNEPSGKVKPDKQQKTGSSPLGLAMNNVVVAKLLLDAGGDPLLDHGNGSPMDIAKMYNKQPIIELYNKYIK